jgi:simple sugar transport system substrate-binding protein
MLEAQKHNPDIEVDIIWLYTWFDPAKEAGAAQALIDEGADIIVQHTDSPAPVQVAENAGVYAFGQASNMSAFGPNAHLVSIVDDWDTYYVVDDWDTYYVDRVGQVMDGTWTGGDTWWGFTKDGQGGEVGMVALESYNVDAMGEDLVAEALALEAALANGDRHAFPCEGLLKQDGSVPDECAAGAANLDDWPTLLSMDWYVQGIDASLPN